MAQKYQKTFWKSLLVVRFYHNFILGGILLISWDAIM